MKRTPGEKIFARRSSLRIARTACCAALLSCTPAIFAAPEYVSVLRAASAAASAGQNELALSNLKDVAKVRPDYPRIQINIARFAAMLGKKDESIAALEKLAAMGLRLDPAGDKIFEGLASDPRFIAVSKRLAAGPGVFGEDRAKSFTVDGVTGILESCARNPKTGDLFFGDVRNRCIWKSKAGGGALEKFTRDPEALDGVFRIAFSPDGETIWASTATVAVMTGTDAEDGRRTGIAAIDASTGKIKARYNVADDGRKHLIGDLLVLPDGAVLATDSLSPIVWLLPPEGTILQPAIEHDEFMSLQGIAFGENPHTFYVADYSNGIWRVDFDTRKSTLLVAPANASFFGVDGLQAVPGGLLAIQNGINPQRILKIEPAASGPSKATILACGLPAMTDLALGERSGDSFQFVADSGWSLFEPGSDKHPAPRSVHIISIPIE